MSAPKEDDEREIEGYQKANEWALRVFNRHLNRYEAQERKAARYLTTVVILIGLVGFSSGSVARRIFPLSGPVGITTLLAGALTMVFLGGLCYWCFQVLRTEDLKILPPAPKLVDLFREHGKAAAYDRLSRDMAEAAAKNRDVTMRMGSALKWAHRALVGVVISAAIFGIGLVAAEAFSANHQGNQKIELHIDMSDEEGSSESNSSEPGDQNDSNGKSSSASGGPGDRIEKIEFPEVARAAADCDKTLEQSIKNQDSDSDEDSSGEN